MKKIYLAGISALILLTSGCSTVPTHLDLIIKSSNDINPDYDDISSPLMLNFYELDSAEQFSKLDYWTLIDNGKDRLNSDLISENKHVIIPSQEQHYKIIFDKNSKFLGIIGSFRNLDANTTWRKVINLKPLRHNNVEIRIQGNQILDAK